MKFEITEPQIEKMLQDGIKTAIDSIMGDRYGVGARLKIQSN